MRLIDADALIEWWQEFADKGYSATMEAIVENLKDAPTIDAELIRRGEWKLTDFDDEQTYECSICGTIWTFLIGTPADNGAKYCPNCGAKMDGEREGE